MSTLEVVTTLYVYECHVGHTTCVKRKRMFLKPLPCSECGDGTKMKLVDSVDQKRGETDFQHSLRAHGRRKKPA
jgi:hypothetical protein